MSDIKTFEDQIRKLEQKRIENKRSETEYIIRDLIGVDGDFGQNTDKGNEKRELLNGLSMYEAIHVMSHIGIDEEIEESVKNAMNRIATKLIGEIHK